MISPEAFIHNHALVDQGACIGAQTRVWAFAHVLNGAVVGTECNICDHTFIEGKVVVGNRVTIKCGVFLWDGVRIEDDVFIGPNAVFTNDKSPRSKHYPVTFSETLVCRGASIGANATILPGLRVGEGAMVGAGAVVTRSVPPNAIVVGNPARIVGYVDAKSQGSASLRIPPGTRTSIVRDVRLINLRHVADMRGNLSVTEWHHDLPFVPRRAFFVYDVPNKHVRGEHAHKACHEFLMCIHGSMAVVVDDGTNREEFVLDEPDMGVYLPPMVWRVHYKYSHDAVCAVLASHEYDAADYVRDYNEFLKIRQAQ